MVTKENYEIWMIDQMDGNLSHADEQALVQFLEEHPELNIDCTNLNSYTLEPEEFSFSGKLDLIKTEADEFEIPQTDYNAILSVENNEGQPGEELHQVYKSAILKPDQNIKYPYKSSLKRAVLIPIVSQQFVRRFAIAASIVIAVLLSVVPLSNDSLDIQYANTIEEQKDNVDSSINIEEAVVSKKEDIKQKVQTTKYNNLALVDIKENDNTLRANIETFEKLKPKGITLSSPIEVNAYEVALNSIMPLMIMNNLTEQQYYANLAKERQQVESEKLSRKAQKMAGRAKVINFLSGNETTIKKYINKEGQLIAYEVESEGVSFIRKVKSGTEIRN